MIFSYFSPPRLKNFLIVVNETIVFVVHACTEDAFGLKSKNFYFRSFIPPPIISDSFSVTSEKKFFVITV